MLQVFLNIMLAVLLNFKFFKLPIIMEFKQIYSPRDVKLLFLPADE